jgi:ABC-type dipeptide/oligopeptide/nickel transport system permease component
MGGGNLVHLGERLYHLFLPALTQGLILAAFIMRLTRSSILEVLGEDYIRTARSKGLSETAVLYKHALRNALIPLTTVVGIFVTILLGSAVLVEIVFSRPGIGRLIIEAVIAGDFPIVQSVLMLYAGSVVVINLAVDITYAFLDPRIRQR